MSIGLYILRDRSACAGPDSRTRVGSDLLRLALGHHYATDPADWQLGREESGARTVIGGPRTAPALSLTHSGDLLVAAVADAGSIGVDVERLRGRRYAAIANFLGWPPLCWAQAGAPTANEFLHLWTLWEALFKALPRPAPANASRAFASQVEQIGVGVAGAVVTAQWSAQSWFCPGRCWLSVVVRPSMVPAPQIPLFRVDSLAGDMESARITEITASEGEIHL